MAKATHTGSCQICGRTQKLPNGCLSTHGYTVQWGFFSGTCGGSGHLPFEQSKGLIDGAIKRATEQRDRTAALSAEYKAGILNEGDGGTKAWVSVYHRATYRGTSSHYTWEQVDVLSETHTNAAGDYSWERFYYIGKDGKQCKIETYGQCKTVEETRKYLNRAYARSLDKIVEQLDTYIAWQQNRIKDWKPTSLKPVA